MSQKHQRTWLWLPLWLPWHAAHGNHQERLEREYDLDLITTAPTVVYEVLKTNKETIYVDSQPKLPAINDIDEIREPIARCNILVPADYLGNVITLCMKTWYAG